MNTISRTVRVLLICGGVFLCVATPVFADSGIAFTLFLMVSVAIIPFILVVFTELIIIRIMTRVNWWIALGCSLSINILSFIVGLIFIYVSGVLEAHAIIFVIMFLGFISFYTSAKQLGCYLSTTTGFVALVCGGSWIYILDKTDWGIRLRSDIDVDLEILAIFIFFFGLTLASEVWLAKLFIPREKLDRTIFWTNVASNVIVDLAIIYLILCPVPEY